MSDKNTQKQFWSGIGRRKTAIATVRITEGEKTIELNGENAELPSSVIAPLELTGKLGAFGLSIRVSGGGTASHLDAMRLAIARALEKFNPELRTTLKKAGFLTRDPREKERKKPGLKGARRAPQWAKR